MGKLLENVLSHTRRLLVKKILVIRITGKCLYKVLFLRMSITWLVLMLANVNCYNCIS